MPHGESSPPPPTAQRQPQPCSVTPTTSAPQGDPTLFSLLGGCCTQPRCAAWALLCFWVSVGADGAQHLHSSPGVLQQEALTPSLPVNYRGSLGFGQDSVNSLPGNVGAQDVRDVQVGCACPIVLWVSWVGNLGTVTSPLQQLSLVLTVLCGASAAGGAAGCQPSGPGGWLTRGLPVMPPHRAVPPYLPCLRGPQPRGEHRLLAHRH